MATVAKRKPGRPNTLTRKLGAAICKDIEDGMPSYHAAEAHGVNRQTFAEWVRRGLGFDERKPTEMLVWFAGEVEKAKALRTKRRVRIIEQAGDEDWRATAWMLERTDPETFGRREVHDHSGAVEHTVRVELAFDPSPSLPSGKRNGNGNGKIHVALDPAIDVEAVEET